MRVPHNTPISSKKVQDIIGNCIDLLEDAKIDLESDPFSCCIPAKLKVNNTLDTLRGLSERRFNQLGGN